MLTKCRCLSDQQSFSFTQQDMPGLRKQFKRELIQKTLINNTISTIQGQQQQFDRRCLNTRKDSCWINSMIQMILAGLDHLDDLNLSSALGLQLMMSQSEMIIDPLPYKMLLQNERDKNPMYDTSESIVANQQDAREMIRTLSMDKNNEAWFDISSLLQITLLETFTCWHCEYTTEKELEPLLNTEINVPSNGIRIKNVIQQMFNDPEDYPERRCDNGCIGASKQNQIITERSSPFLMVFINRRESNASNLNDLTDDLQLIDSNNIPRAYELIAAVQHIGRITEFGAEGGHYICDVKCYRDGVFYRTDDEKRPTILKRTEISRRGYIILYKRK